MSQYLDVYAPRVLSVKSLLDEEPVKSSMTAVWNDIKQQNTRSAKWKTELAHKLREDHRWVRLKYSYNLSAFSVQCSKPG
jgi:hypothetical protein